MDHLLEADVFVPYSGKDTVQGLLDALAKYKVDIKEIPVDTFPAVTTTKGEKKHFTVVRDDVGHMREQAQYYIIDKGLRPASVAEYLTFLATHLSSCKEEAAVVTLLNERGDMLVFFPCWDVVKNQDGSEERRPFWKLRFHSKTQSFVPGTVFICV